MKFQVKTFSMKSTSSWAFCWWPDVSSHPVSACRAQKTGRRLLLRPLVAAAVHVQGIQGSKVRSVKDEVERSPDPLSGAAAPQGLVLWSYLHWKAVWLPGSW